MNKRQKRDFARRFSCADWGWLCAQLEFLIALEKSPAEAEAVARKLLDSR